MGKSLSTKRRAMFIGREGSMGFHEGSVYDITLIYDEERKLIWLTAPGGLYCPYESIAALHRNWRVLTEYKLYKKGTI